MSESRFVRATVANLTGLLFFSPGPYLGCDEGACPHVSDDVGDEGSFSWSRCESCGSTFGGQRYAAHARLPVMGPFQNEEDYLPLVHLEVCTDCLCFHANGDEPENWQQQHPGEERDAA